jgi:hypothetical protein
MRGIRIAMISAVVFLFLQAPVMAVPVKVSSVLVTGAFRTGENAVRSMLFAREGSVYRDRASLDRALAFSRARMEQTREYTFIDMFVDAAVDGSVEVTVSVAESFSSPVGPLVLFPNSPAYGLSLGFFVGDTIQAAAMGVLLPYPLDAALVMGNRIMGPADGIIGRLITEWTPSPELAFTLIQDTGYAITDGLSHRLDVTSAFQAAFDLSWLADAMGIGLSLWGEARKGWYEYDFMSVDSMAEMILRPFRIVTVKASADIYSAWGDFPPYDDAPARLKTRFDSAPCAYAAGPSEVSFRLELLLGKLFDIPFIPLKPGISLFVFGAAGSVLPDVASFDWTSSSFAAGGGVEIRLLPPVPLVFRAGWSHAIALDAGSFFFQVIM